MKLFVILLLPFLFACQERFRYPCQDPRNWEEHFCKKPYCSSNGTCPEDLRHYNKQTNQTSVSGNGCTGSCK